MGDEKHSSQPMDTFTPEFRGYCLRFGILDEHLPLAWQTFSAVSRRTIACLSCFAEQGMAPGLQSYLDELREIPELYPEPHPFCPQVPGDLDASLKLEVRRSLKPLAGVMRLATYRVLEEELLDFPLYPPLGNEATKAAAGLAFLGSITQKTPALDAYAARLSLTPLARIVLMGIVETILQPWPWQCLSESFKQKFFSPVGLCGLLRPLVTISAFEELCEGARRCGRPGLADHPFIKALQEHVHMTQVGPFSAKQEFTHDSSLTSGRFCPNPFENAQVNSDGKVYACCPTMLPVPIGTLRLMDLPTVWNSARAQAVRESILDGSFRYCDGRRCQLIKNGALPKRDSLGNPEHQRIVDEHVTTFPDGPSIVNMAYDRTCNLVCPSCRAEKIVFKGEEQSTAELIHDAVLTDGLRGVRRLFITGSGDPFVSRIYLNFLRTFDAASRPDVRINLSTNGVLLTPAMWESICNSAVDWIDVSIDAATAETYALNRGGDFDQLLENLHFMGELYRQGKILSFNLHFVVQLNNFREMPQFIALGRQVGASRVSFKELQDWGNYPAGEFRRRAITAPEHPQHVELVTLLQDPAFRDPLVDMMDMVDLMPL